MARKKLPIPGAGPVTSSDRPARKSVADMIAGGAEPPKTRPVLGVMYQVEPRHRDALQDAARKARDERGGTGRADASGLLRALLDEWIEGGAKLPPRG